MFEQVEMNNIRLHESAKETVVKKVFTTSKSIVLLLGVVLAIGLWGCSSESDNGSKPENDQTETTPPDKGQAMPGDSTKQGRIEYAMQLWDQGKRTEAIEEFVTVDWNKTEHFSQSSVFRLSEQEFVALPSTQREAKMSEVMTGITTMKQLGKAVVEHGRASDTPQKYYDAVAQFGEMLAGPDKLLTVQMTGKAIKKLAETPH